MTLVVTAIVAGLVGVAVGLAVARRARHRIAARALADRVRTSIEPYLRRKAAELGLPAQPTTWTARTPPEEIVEHSAALAARLLAHERQEPGRAVDSLGYARTEPGL